MANFDVDKEFFDNFKNGIKSLSDALSSWQQKDTAMTALAQHHAKTSIAPNDPNLEAHVYMHKKAIKKAMQEHAKSMDGQGGPGVKSAEPRVNHMPITSQTHSAASVQLPMAGQAHNTGANGNMVLGMPSQYPGQMQSQSNGPTRPATQGAPVPSNMTPPSMPQPPMAY